MYIDKETRGYFDWGVSHWGILFMDGKDAEIKDKSIPYFFGGLDHIEVKKKGIYFFDIGSNGMSQDFVIRRDNKR